MNRRKRIRQGQSLPDEYVVPRVAAGGLGGEFADFRLAPEDATLPRLGFGYAFSLGAGGDLSEPEADPSELAKSLDDDNEPTMTDDLFALEEKDATDDESEGSDLDCPSDGSVPDTSGDKEDTPLLPKKEKRRRFQDLKAKAGTACVYPIQDHSVMSAAFNDLIRLHPKADGCTLLGLYNEKYLHAERKSAIDEGRMPRSYHPTTLIHVEAFLKSRRREAGYAREWGSFDGETMDIFRKLDDALQPRKGEAVVEHASIPIQQANSSAKGPEPIQQTDILEEIGRGLPKKTNEGESGEPSPLSDQGVTENDFDEMGDGGDGEPVETSIAGGNNKALRTCTWCGRPLRKALNGYHIPDGSPFGRCPDRNVAEEVAARLKLAEEREMVEKKIAEKAAAGATIIGDVSSNKGRSCSKCRRPYSCELELSGVFYPHRQFKVLKEDGGYTQNIFCPLVDELRLLEEYESEKRDRQKNRWRRENAKRKREN
ncbi:hypothetical protein Pmar_PMAR006696 [Perkinsus marinus ATCC 50983]|uniref:Uncharacterized protein n=1 Tax=Perkinsus marinus (strain ATCC 50983 / TXsc) TaxID=423536 RepID=C5L1N6_PERM5|nr:hypothetical protein Pmar_PMAR006696 [Perkinsus marinus ATCC 50983]EER09357.1 hypothetical protein Pmar_PMAR006696 [Perkinsus marinus ATCC 50983]|eukprot:XP_002777541.1 hypothetical protein Pmar_PMAR006696 [Perkinsus marinus ATCC 50983]